MNIEANETFWKWNITELETGGVMILRVSIP